MTEQEERQFAEAVDILVDMIDTLPKHTQASLRTFLPNVKNLIDIKYLFERLKDPIKRRYPKVSVDTFLDSKKYLWIWESVYPKVRQICKNIVEWWYREWVEVAWIGSGKSYSSEIMACYAAHHLLCLRDPHRNYKLSSDKNIAILNMGINATQAREVVFTGIRNFIIGSPRFQQFFPKTLSGTILFENQKILLASWNSKSTTPLWYNVFFATLDEAAFYLDNDEKAVAQEIYESLQRRIVSRFWNEWLLMMISSPRYIEDFIMRKLEESRQLDEEWNLVAPHIFAIQLPTRKVKNISNIDRTKCFYFNPRTTEIIASEKLEEEIAVRKVNYIDTLEFNDSFDLWEIPDEYKASFRQNPERAKRDFWATPSITLSWFFPSINIIRECYNKDRINPVTWPWTYKFADRPLRLPYYIHVDIWFNKDGKGDHTWIAMWHFGWWVKDEATWETRMNIVIDFVEQIAATEWKWEIDLSDVRQRIYDLKSLWYNIAMVTLDWYMSRDFMQVLKKKWIRAEYLSVDKTIDPYNLLKAAIYEKRIDLPYYEPLDKELIRLELIKWIKVDHPQNGSKDCSDAVAWVVFNVYEYTHAWELWIRVALWNMTQKEKEVAEREQKERSIQIQQRMLDKQNEIMERLFIT